MKFLIVSFRKSTMVWTPNTLLLTGSKVSYKETVKISNNAIIQYKSTGNPSSTLLNSLNLVHCTKSQTPYLHSFI